MSEAEEIPSGGEQEKEESTDSGEGMEVDNVQQEILDRAGEAKNGGDEEIVRRLIKGFGGNVPEEEETSEE